MVSDAGRSSLGPRILAAGRNDLGHGRRYDRALHTGNRGQVTRPLFVAKPINALLYRNSELMPAAEQAARPDARRLQLARQLSIVVLGQRVQILRGRADRVLEQGRMEQAAYWEERAALLGERLAQLEERLLRIWTSRTY